MNIKKQIFSYIIILLITFSCSKGQVEDEKEDLLYDLPNVEFSIHAVNNLNQDIFAISKKDSLLSTGFKILFNNRSYIPEYIQYSGLSNCSLSKAVPNAVFYGGIIYYNVDLKKHVLRIGKFQVDKSFDYVIVLDWGDSSKDEVRIVHTFKKGKTGVEVNQNTFYLNGKILPNNKNLIEIIR